MPTVARQTSPPANYDVAVMRSQVNGLLTRMRAGNSITAADVQNIISIFAQWKTHAHVTDDLYGIDNFGNRAQYGVGGAYEGGRWSDQVAGTWPLENIATPVPNAQITAGDINSLVVAINSMRSHTHSIYDRTG